MLIQLQHTKILFRDLKNRRCREQNYCWKFCLENEGRKQVYILEKNALEFKKQSDQRKESYFMESKYIQMSDENVCIGEVWTWWWMSDNNFAEGI